MKKVMIPYVIVYLVALFQGFMIVLFPAASVMLIHISYHNLSSSEYGALFIPLISGIILSARCAPIYSLRSVLCVGLLCILISQVLFFVTAWVYPVHGWHVITFFILLVALFFLGLGYGAGLTAINTYVPRFFPNKKAIAMSLLYTVSGFGSAIAPFLFYLFFSKGQWWLIPILLAAIALFLALLVAIYLPNGAQEASDRGKKGPLFFSLLCVLFLYGFLETTFGNWGLIYLHKGREFSTENASYALSLFWISVVLGRLLIGLIVIKIPFQMILAFLPWMIAMAFLLIPEVDSFKSLFALFSFAGFACSGCLPLGFALGEAYYPKATASVSGALLSAYILGYGTSAYGLGLLHQMGVCFSKMYHLAVIPALIMGFILMMLIQARFTKA